jgi:hypothetical protein
MSGVQPQGNGMRQVGYLSIRTEHTAYGIVIPDVNYEQVEDIVQQAKIDAVEDNQTPYYVFIFQNEKLSIFDSPLNIHFYIKEENYTFAGPTIRVHPNL